MVRRVDEAGAETNPALAVVEATVARRHTWVISPYDAVTPEGTRLYPGRSR